MSGSSRYGVVTQFWSPDVQRWTADLGTGWVRLDGTWSDIEPARGSYAWGGIDQAINGARSSGRRVYVSLGSTPPWAGACPSCLPDDLSDWRQFVEAVIGRYRGAGIVFGIWNEPNLGFFLNDSPDGAGYATLFAEANRARQAIDPGSLLAGPETSHHAFGGYFPAVMARIHASMRPDDVVSVHYYADAAIPIRDYMAGVGVAARGRPVWLTEFGIGTCDEERQRQFVDDVLQAYQAVGGTWWANVFPYVLYNGGPCETLVRPDGSYRPAFLDYRRFIAEHP